MESTAEQSGLLHPIIPPRLEDAGLEDPALPPESIHEAFLKAAAAVKSSTASIFHGKDDADDCLNDPSDFTDAVVGIEHENEPPGPGPCTVVKGREAVIDEVRVGSDDDVDEVVDELVVGEEVKLGEDGEACVDGDELVVGEEVKLGEDGEACVDGFRGLDIKEKENAKKIGDDVEGFV